MRFLTVELDGTQRRISKSDAKDLIASGCYKWSDHFQFLPKNKRERREGLGGVSQSRVLVAVPLELRPKMPRTARRQLGSLPVKLPPKEVPNCIFRPPDSDEWKLAHRNIERDLEMAFATSDSCAANAAMPVGDSPLLSPSLSA
jgi:hypothetical protein